MALDYTIRTLPADLQRIVAPVGDYMTRKAFEAIGLWFANGYQDDDMERYIRNVPDMTTRRCLTMVLSAYTLDVSETILGEYVEVIPDPATRQSMRQLLASDWFPVPKLFLDFTKPTETLDPRITFTRASGGTRVNSAGLIETLTTDQPRFDYDPVTLAPRGLLIEESRVNNFLNATIDGATLGTQGVTVTAVPWTVSFYGTGTITFSGAYAGSPLVGSGAYPTRSSVTFTPSAGTLTCTVTGTVSYAQCELGSFATSFIPTAGASVTRAADVASMTGTNFSSWFNATEGTFVARGDSVARLASTYPNLVSASTAVDSNNRISLYFNANVGVAGEIRTGGSGVSLQSISYTDAAAVTGVTAYKANDTNSAAAGVIGTRDTSCAIPTVTGLSLCSTQVGGSANLNGHIQRITYYNKRLPDNTLKGLAT